MLAHAKDRRPGSGSGQEEDRLRVASYRMGGTGSGEPLLMRNGRKYLDLSTGCYIICDIDRP